MAKTLTYKLTIPDYGATSQGLIREVLEKELHLSRKEISRLKFGGEILLNGEKVYVSRHMQVGDELTLIFPEDKPQEAAHSTLEPEILYEEDDFVVVNKPVGVPTHPGHGHLDDSMGTILQAYYQKQGRNFVIRPIGRLDSEVSGAVIYAKNQ